MTGLEVVQKFANIHLFYNRPHANACTISSTHSYWPCWILHCIPRRSRSSTDKEHKWETLLPFLRRPFVHLQVERLHTSLSLCLCFFFFFDFLWEESEEEALGWEKEKENSEGWRMQTRHLDKSLTSKKGIQQHYHCCNRKIQATRTCIMNSTTLIICRQKGHKVLTFHYMTKITDLAEQTGWVKYPGSRTTMRTISMKNFSTLHSTKEIVLTILRHNRV